MILRWNVASQLQLSLVHQGIYVQSVEESWCSRTKQFLLLFTVTTKVPIWVLDWQNCAGNAKSTNTTVIGLLMVNGILTGTLYCRSFFSHLRTLLSRWMFWLNATISLSSARFCYVRMWLATIDASSILKWPQWMTLMLKLREAKVCW